MSCQGFSIIVVVKYVTGVSRSSVLIFLLTAPRPAGSPGGADQWVVVSWRMPAGRWERRCHPADERLRRAAQNQGNSARKCCVCVRTCVCVLCESIPNGACLEGLLRITGAAAFYFTHLFFLKLYHSGFIRISHMLVWLPTCISF